MTWPTTDYIGMKPCSIDHDHDDSWFCDDGGAGTIRLDVVQRDIRLLTEAMEALKEALKEQR